MINTSLREQTVSGKMKISPETWIEIKNLKKPEQSIDEFIKELLAMYKNRGTGQVP